MIHKARQTNADLHNFWVGGPIENDFTDLDLAKFSPKDVVWDVAEGKPGKRGVGLFIDLIQGKNIEDLEQMAKDGNAYGKMHKVCQTGSDLMASATVVVSCVADYLAQLIKTNVLFCEFAEVFLRQRYRSSPEIVIAIPDADYKDAVYALSPYLNNLDGVFEVLFQAETDHTADKEHQYLCDTLCYSDPGYDLTENGGNDRDKLRALWTAYAIHADLLKEPFAMTATLYTLWILAQNDNDEPIGWENFDDFTEFMNEYLI